MREKSNLLSLTAALVLVFGLAAQTPAAEVKVGGSLRTELTYGWYDDIASPSGESVFKLDFFNVSTSRLKFTYLSDDKKFKGYVEVRLRSRSTGNNVDIRQAYFSYDWDGGNLLMGQYNGLSDDHLPNQYLDSTNCLFGFGKLWFNRLEQIRLTLGQKHKLILALEHPSHNGDFVSGDGTLTGLGYRYFPAFAGAVELNLGNVVIYPWIRWEWERIDTGSDDVNWHSLDFGLNITGDFGLIGFLVGATYGINSSAVGVVEGPATPLFNNDFSERSDHKQFTAFGELRIGGFRIGGGYAKASRDELEGVAPWSDDPYTAGLYANYAIPFGKITFIPEILWESFGQDSSGADLGDTIKVGLFAVLNF